MTQNEFLSRSQVDFGHFWKFCTLGDPSQEIEKIRLGSKLKILFQPLQVVPNDPKRVSVTVPGRFWPFLKILHLGGPLPGDRKNSVRVKIENLIPTTTSCFKWPKTSFYHGLQVDFGHFLKFCTSGDPSQEIEKFDWGQNFKIDSHQHKVFQMTQNEFLSWSKVDFRHFRKFCCWGDPSGR